MASLMFEGIHTPALETPMVLMASCFSNGAAWPEKPRVCWRIRRAQVSELSLPSPVSLTIKRLERVAELTTM